MPDIQYAVTDPATGEVLQTYPTAEPAEVEAAIEAASAPLSLEARRTTPRTTTNAAIRTAEMSELRRVT